ncbi:TPA: transposase [Pseudomonas aeruginosa]|nr:transposase [Pseudomonas aeruginosa]
MMGQLPGGQQRLFYSFNLEDHVPAQHLLRSIDQCLDLSDLRAYLADFYSPIGRPSIDPELMVRMLVVGYCYGIRSERRLCEEVHLNLAYRWFCRLGLEDEVPNLSTFSKNRHGRFRDSDLFRWLFNEVLRRCMAAGLVKGEGFAVDASIIKADASRQRGVAGDEVDWNDPKLSSRAVREYLEALDEEALAEALPKKISLTDPQSRWTAAPGGPAFFAYSTNYLIDTEHGVIMDVEATPAHRTAEVDSTRTMVERVKAQFDLTPERLIGDTAYGTAPMLAWMVEEKDIEPHVPVWDKTERKDDSLSSNDFHWNQEANEYRCPAGKPLRSEWRAFTLYSYVYYEYALPYDVGLALQYGKYDFKDATFGNDDSYNDWSIGLSKTLVGLDFGLTYSDTSLSGSECAGFVGKDDYCDATLVVSVSKTL